MKEGKYILVFILSLCGLAHCNVFETAISWINLTSESLSSYYCNKYECCDNIPVPYIIDSFQSMLYKKLYGQHIAEDLVFNAISSHIKVAKPRKPLVMSFHGPNGVGKTYMSKMIAQAFFEKGENSRFFHFYYGLDHFPLTEKLSEYKIQLKTEIEAAINSCERSLFVFDGVDQMPPGLLNALMPFIDCPNCAGKTKKNKSIFIFLTNTGSLAIQKKLLEKMRDGVKREFTTLHDFEQIVISESFKHNGGLFESLMIKSDAIDIYVPFLPLEKEHVEVCIKEAFQELNTKFTKDLIDQVLEELTFGPEPDNFFSNSGCKRVAQIVVRIMIKLNPYFDDNDPDDDGYSDKSEF